ncbi:MAG: bifunctional aspartate kinase/homoserine dehydrogenase I [Bdellovibrionales bacterium]|nr:bifunctional aspartate kinase/homoserine dehydrogenase I [Bdellovibrionales bacterium]
MRVWKFGGSSVATPEIVEKIVEIVRASEERPQAIIFSAFGGVTDTLLETLHEACRGNEKHRALIEEIRFRHLDAIEALSSDADLTNARLQVKELLDQLTDLYKGVTLTGDVTERTRDHILSFGERLSNLIIHYAFRKDDIDAEFCDARELILTDDAFGNAVVDRGTSYHKIQMYISAHPALQCITGFIGATAEGETTTLGRGGSDYTASIIAAALDAEVLEVWTDVDGIMTADPRKVPSACIVPEITYSEAMELSHFGAKVLYPPTIQPVREKGIPLVVRNTFRPECPGTTVKSTLSNLESRETLTALTSIRNVCLLTLKGSGIVGVPGCSERLFGALGRAGINIILISQASSELSICFAVKAEDASRACDVVNNAFELEQRTGRVDPMVVEENRAIISVVGAKMKELPGVAGSVFSALGRHNISVIAIAQGSSEENISFVVQESQEGDALRAIHKKCFEHTRDATLVLLGPGQVGSALLRQIAKYHDHLQQLRGVDLRIVGIVRSSSALFDASGISEDTWTNTWEQSCITFESQDEILERIIQLRTPNLVVVDCTASDSFNGMYEALITRRIPVITANKKVQTGSLETFQRIRSLAQSNATPWLFETSVGAALPVISTVENLVATGDTIYKLEAVLSGSLSYIFFRLQLGISFASAVQEARELGYLEPDPRDDLDGTDFARKLLILSRLIGAPLELPDISIEPLLESSLLLLPSIQEFLVALPQMDAPFQERIESATARGERLRYVGCIERNETTGEYSASIELRSVDATSPLYGLSSTDNIVSIQSLRYSVRPLVIQGAGAGPEITASGVFADVLHAIGSARDAL